MAYCIFPTGSHESKRKLENQKLTWDVAVTNAEKKMKSAHTTIIKGVIGCLGVFSVAFGCLRVSKAGLGCLKVFQIASMCFKVLSCVVNCFKMLLKCTEMFKGVQSVSRF